MLKLQGLTKRVKNGSIINVDHARSNDHITINIPHCSMSSVFKYYFVQKRDDYAGDVVRIEILSSKSINRSPQISSISHVLEVEHRLTQTALKRL